VSQQQQALVSELSGVCAVSVSQATKLLRSFNWDKEQILKAYTADPEQFLKDNDIGAHGPDAEQEADEEEAEEEKKHQSKSVKPKPQNENRFDCPFCMESYPMSETLALACQHRYCKSCWKSWVLAEFDKGSECIFSTCMAFKCGELLLSEWLLTLLPYSKAQKVQQWLTANFMANNHAFRWCTRPGCDKAVQYDNRGMQTVQCECGQSFCFACSQEPHEPAPCQLVAEWLKKDNSIAAWLEANKGKKEIKNCTKCHEMIEKNQGCKHMTCRNCKHEFCWLCFQNWRGHNESLCNNYDQKEEEQAAKLRSTANAEIGDLRRYQFYYARFENHQKSLRFADRSWADLNERMRCLQLAEGTSSVHVTFLKHAFEVVLECRRLLQWSYCWLYYMEKAGQTTLKAQLKLHMDTLEGFTEDLTSMTEQPLASLISKPRLRQNIVNLTKVMHNYRSNIIDFAKANH